MLKLTNKKIYRYVRLGDTCLYADVPPVQVSDAADGPQGDPVSGPAKTTAPDRGADQEHLGLRQGLLRQRGQARPGHPLGQLLRSARRGGGRP